MSLAQKSPAAQLAQGRPVPAKAKKKKINVSIKEPTSEDAAGAFHQACRRRTSNTLISNNWAARNAEPDARAVLSMAKASES